MYLMFIYAYIIFNYTWCYLIISTYNSTQARFSSLPPKTTMQSHLKNLKLPARVSNPRLRAMQPEDVPAVHKLLNAYLDET